MMNYLKKHKLLAPGLILFALTSCGSERSLQAVDSVDLERYAGTWYEIERLPNRFENGLTCVTASYTLREDGKVTVLNRGQKTSKPGSFKEIKGTAWRPDKNKQGVLKVRFFWPFAGDYYIISLDSHYQYALVGDPSRKFLWILSRTAALDESIVRNLKDRARSLGFNTDEMIAVDQECNKPGNN